MHFNAYSFVCSVDVQAYLSIAIKLCAVYISSECIKQGKNLSALGFRLWCTGVQCTGPLLSLLVLFFYIVDVCTSIIIKLCAVYISSSREKLQCLRIVIVVHLGAAAIFFLH